MRSALLRLVIVSIAVLGFGCPSDPLVSSAPFVWRLLAAVSSGAQTKLTLLSMPEGALVADDVYAAANGEPLTGAVTAIAQFRSMLFLLQPDQQRIEVLDATSFRRIARISTAPHAPRSICFANATTALTANGDSTVSVIDLTAFVVARVLTVGTRPVAIAAMGNQVCVCNQADATVSIIDTRTLSVVTTVAVAPYPTFVAGSNEQARSFCIVSLGAGKLQQSETPTAAQLTFYDPFAQQVLATAELSQLYRSSMQTLPRSFVGTPYSTAFVVLDNEVQLIDIAGQRVVATVLIEPFSSAAYDFARDVVFVWGQSEQGTLVVGLDPQSGAERSRTVVPFMFQAAAGL